MIVLGGGGGRRVHGRRCRVLQPNITRSKDEAIAILQDFAAQINGSPDKFAELASKHSDCSSHKNGGDLGFFKPVRSSIVPCCLRC